ncbi:YoaK family protein [Pedobacter sp. NJ-S-72]
MLRHLGAKRTPQHNLRLATLLGLTAGFVNAAGFLGFSVLTTNVTGHAALFAERIALQDWKTAQVVALWMFLFLAGAFISSLILSFTGHNQRYSYSIPIFIEIIILFFSGLYGESYDGTLVSKEIFAGSLLFAMGLQNSLVSIISGSVVRTTHLTGTFTDLGIELAQLFNKEKGSQSALRAKIKLRLVIIFFFMTGAIVGAYFFHHFRFKAFYGPIGILIYALLYDIFFRIKAKRYYQKTAIAVKRVIKP